MAERRPIAPLLGIFLTVFIDLLSFGLVIPDLQLRAESLGARGILLGLALAVFSMAQLVTAPYLGRLSDRIGRRRVLLVTCALAVVSSIVYANAGTLTLVFISRIFAGIAGANVGVAFAYVADVTKPEDRAKGLGMVGAAFGLGFIFGPVLGALLVREGDNKPFLLGYVAAGLALVNLVYVYFLLPESRHAHHEQASHSLAHNFRVAFSTPGLSLLLIIFFVYNFAFTNLESTFFRLIADPNWIFGLNELQAKTYGAYILALVGVVGVIMQGFVIRLVTPIFGEVNLVRVSFLIVAPTLAALPHIPLWIPFLIGTVVLSTGTGLGQPSLSSLISRGAPIAMQGGIFGITQALGALARCVGPIVSNTLFEWHPTAPYWLAGGLVLVPAVAAWFVRMPDGESDPESFVVD